VAAGGNLKKALIAGILANFGVAVAKLWAFAMTRSAAMLAEGLHSIADSSNQLLLLIGWKRSQRPASDSHPFGYGVERYFWTFVVSINIFLLGAVFAIYEGIQKILHPHEMENVIYNYIALGIGMVFEAYALRVAWNEFKHWRRTQKGSLWQALRDAKDLSLPTVLFEDAAALVGLLIATIGITLSQVLHLPVLDGVASVLIGVVLLVVAWFLSTESYSLLLGEGAGRSERRRIRTILHEEPCIHELLEMGTLQRGPDSMVVALTLRFKAGLQTREIEAAVKRLEERIKTEVPAATHIFIEVGSLRAEPA